MVPLRCLGYVQNTPPIPAPARGWSHGLGYIVEYLGATGGLGQLNSTGSGHVGGSKLGNPDIFGYIRLYPSLERRGGQRPGKYGAFAEIRQDASSRRRRRPIGLDLGWGDTAGPAVLAARFRLFSAPTSSARSASARPTSPDQLDDDRHDGKLRQRRLERRRSRITGALGPVWPFEDVGNLYTTRRCYLCGFAGFDFGAWFQPNTGNMSGSFNCGGFAGVGCDTLSSTGSGDMSRRRNTFDGVLRWRGSFGIVGIALTGGGIASGRVQNSDTQPFPPGVFNRNGLAVGDVGAQITIGGLALQAHGTAGTFNPSGLMWNTLPLKGEGRGVAWTAGASYTMGPLVFGARYFNDTGAGNQTPTNAITDQVGERTDWGIAAGATYSVTPGFGFFASYIYGQVKQNGWDNVAAHPGSKATIRTCRRRHSHLRQVVG